MMTESSRHTEKAVTSDFFPAAKHPERMGRVMNVADVPSVPLMPEVITDVVSGLDMALSVPEVDPYVVGVIYRRPHEQMMVVLEGHEAILEGTMYPLVAGDVIRIPPDVPHEGNRSERTCRILEVFCPARRDLEQKLAKAGRTKA